MCTTIAYAALKDKNGNIYIGYRHNLIGWNMPKGHFNGCEQGFLTNTGEFVDRVEALRIASTSNQIIHKHGNPNELYSEDIFEFTNRESIGT